MKAWTAPAVIEQTIAEALGQLTGDHYTIDIRSKEAVEFSLHERNTLAFARFQGVEAVTERDKIVLVLNKHTVFKRNEDKSA